uniref:Uncharacterized protein n=1 Tax=Opuntia streptacantha TaxID=393608 RepID=A0A7C9DP38_OPUST
MLHKVMTTIFFLLKYIIKTLLIIYTVYLKKDYQECQIAFLKPLHKTYILKKRKMSPVPWTCPSQELSPFLFCPKHPQIPMNMCRVHRTQAYNIGAAQKGDDSFEFKAHTVRVQAMNASRQEEC